MAVVKQEQVYSMAQNELPQIIEFCTCFPLDCFYDTEGPTTKLLDCYTALIT